MTTQPAEHDDPGGSTGVPQGTGGPVATAAAEPEKNSVDLRDVGTTTGAPAPGPVSGPVMPQAPGPPVEPMKDSSEADLRLSRVIAPARDRRLLAMSLLVLVGLVVAGVGVGVVFAKDKDRADLLERILGIVFGPLVTLLGTSFTWYYASAPQGEEVRLSDREG
ncbi:MAG TPA: hypothetical protein VFP72_05970 [Kineosporiaceae bacterium]|nr:hypothetical protein [Kineosporiaceae bacterium]